MGNTIGLPSVTLFRGVYNRVARKLGVDPSYVSRVARGERKSVAVQEALDEEIGSIRDHLNNHHANNHDGNSHHANNGDGSSTPQKKPKSKPDSKQRPLNNQISALFSADPVPPNSTPNRLPFPMFLSFSLRVN